MRPTSFPQQVRDLQAWVSGDRCRKGIHFAPSSASDGPKRAGLWILGSSDYGAQLAAHFGLPYAFAYFFTEGRGHGGGAASLSKQLVGLARSPIAARDDLRVGTGCGYGRGSAHLLHTRAMACWFRAGVRDALVPPEVAAAHPYTGCRARDRSKAAGGEPVGTAPQVAQRLRALAESLSL